jgi:hypothetical protein
LPKGKLWVRPAHNTIVALVLADIKQSVKNHGRVSGNAPWSHDVIYSGLDWSGSPGHEPHDPFLALAIVSIVDANLPNLHRGLEESRRVLGLPPSYVFRNVGASAAVHRQLYEVLDDVALDVRTMLIDKRLWTTQFRKSSRGLDRIGDGIVALVMACPDVLVAEQRLLIDLEHRDRRVARDWSTVLRKSLRGTGRKSFGRVQACPDSRREYGDLIQVADMIAGEVHEQGGSGGRFLPTLGAKFQLV